MKVNSRHHQAVQKLGRGFVATAHSSDGVIEVIENTQYPAIGVQFHPESLFCIKKRKEFLNILNKDLCFKSMVLAERGKKAEYKIVIPTKASPAERYAAEELVTHIKKTVGVDLPIVTDDETAAPPKKAIFLGSTRHSLALIGDNSFKPDSLGSDGFRIVVRGESVILYGSPKRGALYAAYDFLERFAGCRWYASWHCVTPRIDRLLVPANWDDTQKPAFEMRQPYWYDINRNQDFAARLRVNGFNHIKGPIDLKYGGDDFRFGGGLSSCHTFNRLLPPDEFFDSHPEYFSLVKGKRRKKHSQLCLTNPDVLRIVTERVLERIRKDPGAKFYGVSQNDWYNFCECANCMAVDKEEESHAGTMVRFINAVAEKVEKEFPDVIIETLAYQYTRKPPKKTRLRRNVVPCLCTIECDFARSIPESPYVQNKSFQKDIEIWKKQTDKLYLWDYTTEFQDYPIPFPNVYALQGNIKFFRDNNVKELYEQGAYQGRHGEFAELKAWLLAKLMWNPNQPLKPLIDDFFAGYYGKAAPYVREYFEEMHRRQLTWSANAHKPLKIWKSVVMKSLPDDFISWAKPIWRKAKDAVKDDPKFSYNVRMTEFSFDFLRAMRLYQSYKILCFAPTSSRNCGRNEELIELAQSLLDRMSEAKDICLSEHKSRHNLILRNWKNVVNGSMPSADDARRGILEERFLSVAHEGKQGVYTDDPSADDGRAIKLFNTHFEWTVNLPMSKITFIPGKRYKVKARIRVELPEKRNGEGEAFWAGVYDEVKKRSVTMITPKVSQVGDDGYKWYDICTWTPRQDGKEYLWIGPGRFPKNKKSDINALWIDKIMIEPVT
jgi:hypothetical protein